MGVGVSTGTSLPRSHATPTRRQHATGPFAERLAAVSVDVCGSAFEVRH